MQGVEDNEEIIERAAAIDVGKAEVVVCIRIPDPARPGRRQQEIVHSSTLTPRLLVLADRLVELGVTRVVMEATSDYWKPVFYLLESRGLDPWLVNARDVKHLPGRPKTDRLDAVWLAKVAERQMLRPSFVPPRPIRLQRDLTRYRAGLVKARTAEKNRVEKPPALRRGHSVRAACAPRANACARSGHASRAQQRTVDPDARRRGRRERGSCDPTSPPRPASVHPDAAAHPGRGVGDAASTTSLTRCRSLNRTA